MLKEIIETTFIHFDRAKDNHQEIKGFPDYPRD